MRLAPLVHRAGAPSARSASSYRTMGPRQSLSCSRLCVREALELALRVRVNARERAGSCVCTMRLRCSPLLLQRVGGVPAPFETDVNASCCTCGVATGCTVLRMLHRYQGQERRRDQQAQEGARGACEDRPVEEASRPERGTQHCMLSDGDTAHKETESRKHANLRDVRRTACAVEHKTP